MITTKEQRESIVAFEMINLYLKANEGRMKEYAEDKIINQNMNERAEWFDFCQEFPFYYDLDNKFEITVEETLDFLGESIKVQFLHGIEQRFEKLVDEIMEEIDDQQAEQDEQQNDYRRMVI